MLASWLATTVGELLLEVRTRGLEGRELKDTGDRESHEWLMEALRAARPEDPVLSEEGKDDRRRLESSRVWIIDPVDGTREFSEPPRDDWAVHVALWADGDLVAGAVAQPALGRDLRHRRPRHVVPVRTSERPRIAVSRSRPPAFVEALAAEIGAELVPMGSAGAKVISVARDVTDAYVHAGGQYEWDSAAPVAVARAAGLHTSRADGSRAALQPGRRAAAGPAGLPARAGRADRRVRPVRRRGLSTASPGRSRRLVARLSRRRRAERCGPGAPCVRRSSFMRASKRCRRPWVSSSRTCTLEVAGHRPVAVVVLLHDLEGPPALDDVAADQLALDRSARASWPASRSASTASPTVRSAWPLIWWKS